MRHLSIRTDKKQHRVRVIGRLGLTCLTILLVSCGSGSEISNDEGPQFVNDAPTTNVATQTPEPTAEASVSTSVPMEEETVSVEELISPRSAPRFAYLLIDGQLTSYDAVTRTFGKLELPATTHLLEFVASPTGDRVGILAELDSRIVVQFFGADGAPLSEPIPLHVPPTPAASSATPDASPSTGAADSHRQNQLQIDWVPQGNAVIVSGPGVIQHVSMSGAVMPISRTGSEGSVIKAIWSPMDSQVAIQTRIQNGEQSLYMMDTGHDEAFQVEIFPGESDLAISNLQWLPNGRGLLFVSGTQADGEVMNGQLYMYRFSDGEPHLIATSGEGGPNATVSHAVVSPDGHSVVYAVVVRDLGEWHLHSLWIRDLTGGPAIAIPTQSGSPITSIQWTSEGVVWQQQDGSIMVVDEALIPRPLGSEPVATPVATPQEVRSPEATPETNDTPVG